MDYIMAEGRHLTMNLFNPQIERCCAARAMCKREFHCKMIVQISEI